MEYLTHTVDGVDHKFAHLTPYNIFGDPSKPDLNGFVPLYRKRSKLKLLENMKLLELPKEEQLGELIGFDTQPVDLDTFLKWLKTDPLAGNEVVRFSYKSANSAELPKISEESINEVLWKLLDPLGIRPVEGNSDPEPAADNPMVSFGDSATEPNPLGITPTFSATPEVLDCPPNPTQT